MKFAFAKTPKFVQRLFRKRIWAFLNSKNTVYLTFDDGPIPEVTPWVLEQLKKHQAKATFFCIGDNVLKHPEVLEKIISDGHTIGNHTQHHLNGWKTPFEVYLSDIEKCNKAIQSKSELTTNNKLFRPPYGKMTSKQANHLLKKGVKIIMWDILSMDYDKSISEKKCLDNVIRNIKPGSIIIFHDSLKAEKNLRYALPQVLDYIKRQGYNCEGISV
ncbi:polysaccharide deacetylase family protein [Patiriisocius marinus]|uniref:Polysaccharide deacetylase n=1 Tax=Patiriisocius marinus TaxID=1397112 RepID=A0A5J4J1H3_9FLAO|nr:polysaccharide deacetylase family protein [Patiriisocius marinus]GER58347.1 polysaccharide deacetylase [Patiriisocius marinus]